MINILTVQPPSLKFECGWGWLSDRLFSIRCRYFGIQTTWYWCRYAPCALNRIFM